MKHFSILAVLLVSQLLGAQTMRVHTTGGTDVYNIADIDSITFATSAAGIWTIGVPMQIPRDDFSGVVLNDRIYVFGGDDLVKWLIGSTECYDTTSQVWSFMAQMPDSLCTAGASVVSEKAYLIGGVGYHGAGWIWLNSNYEYDPAGNSWSTKLSMPTTRCASAAATVRDTIYVIGGYVGTTAYNAVEAFCPASNSWTGKSSMPTARSRSAVAVVNNTIYVIGGFANGGTTELSTVEAYDPSTDSWSTKASMPTAIAGCKAATYAGNIYVFGGRTGGSPAALNTVEMYDPIANSWTNKTPMLINVYYHQAVELGGNIYILGGISNGSAAINSVQIYNPSLD